jgi:hypothetical protein
MDKADRGKGQGTLDLGDIEFNAPGYEYGPPWKPPTSPMTSVNARG